MRNLNTNQHLSVLVSDNSSSWNNSWNNSKVHFKPRNSRHVFPESDIRDWWKTFLWKLCFKNDSSSDFIEVIRQYNELSLISRINLNSNVFRNLKLISNVFNNEKHECARISNLMILGVQDNFSSYGAGTIASGWNPESKK